MKPTPFSIALGENLQNLRNLRNLTVTELSEIIPATPDDIRKYERGERLISIERMFSVAVALNCSVQNIIEGLDPRSKNIKKPTSEIKMMDEQEHRIMYHMATTWNGDRKALIILVGVYMALPPKRRREIAMYLDMQKDEALKAGEIKPEDLPENIDYMYKTLGSLY